MSYNKVRLAIDELEAARGRYLRERGWHHTSDNPACTWLWQKALPDGRIVMVAEETAVDLQARADSISLDSWPRVKP